MPTTFKSTNVYDYWRRTGRSRTLTASGIAAFPQVMDGNPAVMTPHWAVQTLPSSPDTGTEYQVAFNGWRVYVYMDETDPSFEYDSLPVQVGVPNRVRCWVPIKGRLYAPDGTYEEFSEAKALLYQTEYWALDENGYWNWGGTYNDVGVNVNINFSLSVPAIETKQVGCWAEWGYDDNIPPGLFYTRDYPRYGYHKQYEEDDLVVQGGETSYPWHTTLQYAEITNIGDDATGSATITITGEEENEWTLNLSAEETVNRSIGHYGPVFTIQGTSNSGDVGFTVALTELKCNDLLCNYTPATGMALTNGDNLSATGDYGSFSLTYMPTTSAMNIQTLSCKAWPDVKIQEYINIVQPDGSQLPSDVDLHLSYETPERVGAVLSVTPTVRDFPMACYAQKRSAPHGVLNRAVNLQYMNVQIRNKPDAGDGDWLEWIREWQGPLFIHFDSPELGQLYDSGTRPGWMYEHDHDIHAWRILLEDPVALPLFGLQHEQSVTVDACDATTDWTATNGTASVVSGHLTLTATSADASIEKAVEEAQNWRNYRYLRVNGKKSVAGDVEMTVTFRTQNADDSYEYHDKVYTVPLTTSLADHDIDLIGAITAAQMEADRTDDSNTYVEDHPLRPESQQGEEDPTNEEMQHVPGDYFGLGLIWSYKFGGVANTEVLTLASLKTVRLPVNGADVSAYFNSCMEYHDGADWSIPIEDPTKPARNYHPDKRMAWTVFNRKRGSEIPYGRMDGGVPVGYTEHETIGFELKRFKDVISSEGAPGLTISGEITTDDLDPLLDGETAWFDTDGYAAAWLPQSLRGIQAGRYIKLIRDHGITSSAAILCRVLADNITVYPGIEDPAVSYTNGSVAFPLVATWVLGSAYEGFTLDKTTFQPLNKAVVDVYELGQPTPVEHLKSDDEAFWRTSTALKTAGAPREYKIKTPDVETTVPGKMRHVYFDGLLASQEGGVGGVSYDVTPGLRHHRGYVKSGTIWVGSANNLMNDKLAFTDIDSEISGSQPVVRAVKSGNETKLYLVYVNGANVYRRLSTDEGKNWRAAVSMGTGTQGTMVIAKDGRRFVYRRTSAGAIMGQVYDAQDVLVIDSITVLASGCDDASFDADESVGGSGVWRVAVLYLSSGALTMLKSTDGKTYA